MSKPDFFDSYKKHTAALLQAHEKSKAMSLAVGGHFNAVGLLEYFLLLQHGLQRRHTVIDIGCGSGRLAFQLREYLEGSYVGIDVVPDESVKRRSSKFDFISESYGTASLTCSFVNVDVALLVIRIRSRFPQLWLYHSELGAPSAPSSLRQR